jgi:drug/metabolite transporter (DMT)-like permease
MAGKTVSQLSQKRRQGINAALTSAVFLGMAPVFGKMAISFGFPPLFVVAARTILATALLFLVMLIFRRQFLFIYPAGLLGCIMAGWINGIGSLLYYSSLGRIEASVGQVIYSLYPLFVAMWLWLDHQQPNNLTIIRLLIIVPALILLTTSPHNHVDIWGILMMLASAALYALHLPINQRVLYDMPAPTVTPALFFVNFTNGFKIQAWHALLGLTLVTFFSRLLLFQGVKHLGGLQTAMLGLGELLITIAFSHLLLNERLNLYQWGGVILLMISLALVIFEKPPKIKQTSGGILSWLRPPVLPDDLPWQPHD